MVRSASYTEHTRRRGAIQSIVYDFEAADGSVVLYCLYNYLLRGHLVAVNMTWVLFCGKMPKHLKECPPLTLADL